MFVKRPDADRVSEGAFRAAMETLFKEKSIEIRTHGSGAKARKHIAERRDLKP